MKLKPCPFCGSPVVVDNPPCLPMIEHKDSCYFRKSFFWMEHFLDPSTLKAWNKRKATR